MQIHVKLLVDMIKHTSFIVQLFWNVANMPDWWYNNAKLQFILCRV